MNAEPPRVPSSGSVAAPEYVIVVPAATVVPTVGVIMEIVGTRLVVTVRAAERLVALPVVFVATERKVSPLFASAGFVSVYDAEFAPGMLTPFRCHW